MLVQRATDSLRVLRQAQDEREGDDERPDVPFAQALNLLRLHRAEVRGGKPQNYRGQEKAPEWDEVSASILRKIAAIKAARALKGGQASES